MKIIPGGKAFTKKPTRSRAISQQPIMGENDYQASTFRTVSHDSQGHSMRIVSNVTPDVKREIQVFLSSGIIHEFATEGDLIRWCIYRGLETLHNMTLDPAVSKAHAKAFSWVNGQSPILEQTHWQNMLSTMKAQVKELVVQGNYVPAQQTILVVKEMVGSIDDYWAKKFRKEIIQAYKWVERKAEMQGKKMDREDSDYED